MNDKQKLLDGLICLLRVIDPYNTGGMQHQRSAIIEAENLVQSITGKMWGEIRKMTSDELHLLIGETK